MEVTWLDVVTLAVAAAGLLLGVLAEWRHWRADRSHLSLRASAAVPVGMPGFGDAYFFQVTATNTGSKPVGLSSLGIGLSDGRYIPLLQQPPGSDPVASVLTTGQSRTAWTDYQELKRSLRTERVSMRALHANLADGTTIRRSIPRGFRGFEK